MTVRTGFDIYMHSANTSADICTLAAAGSVVHLSLIVASFLVRSSKSGNIDSTFLLDPLYMRLNNATQFVYPLTIYGVKLSIMLLYKRVFTVSRWLRITIDVGIVVMALVYTAYLALGIATTIQCVDVTSLNTFPVCKNIYDIIITEEVFNVATDMFILVLPMRTISRLQLKKRQKQGVIAIFSIGLLPCCASLTRVGFLIALQGLETTLLWNNALARHFS